MALCSAFVPFISTPESFSKASLNSGLLMILSITLLVNFSPVSILYTDVDASDVVGELADSTSTIWSLSRKFLTCSLVNSLVIVPVGVSTSKVTFASSLLIALILFPVFVSLKVSPTETLSIFAKTSGFDLTNSSTIKSAYAIVKAPISFCLWLISSIVALIFNGVNLSASFSSKAFIPFVAWLIVLIAFIFLVALVVLLTASVPAFIKLERSIP